MILGKWSPSDDKSLHKLETIKIPHMSPGNSPIRQREPLSQISKCIKSPLHPQERSSRSLAQLLFLSCHWCRWCTLKYQTAPNGPQSPCYYRLELSSKSSKFKIYMGTQLSQLDWNRLVEVEWPGDRRQRDDHNLVHFSSLSSSL